MRSAPQRTPLYADHVALGARMVDFAGFEMPVQYTSVLDEHKAVRERAGLFDVSHMGQVQVRGPEATTALERLVSCPVASLAPGAVRYGLLCNEAGGVVDDVTLYRLAEDAYFLCVNAANIDKDFGWIAEHMPAGAEARNHSDEEGMLAIQGPLSAEVLDRIADESVLALERFRFSEIEVAGTPCLVSSTGYTGSKGYEIYCPAAAVTSIFHALLEVGSSDGLQPAGLGARDTLRLEAALALYGHELDDTTSPLEAGLDRFVKRSAGGFIGAEAIERRAAAGHPRQLVGFEMTGRGIPRAEYPIAHEGETVGVVTSGAPSPSLGKAIGLGYVPPAMATRGTGIEVLIRNKAVPAQVVKTPFE